MSHLNTLELCQVIPPPAPFPPEFQELRLFASLPSILLTPLLLEYHVPFLNLYIVSFQKKNSLFAIKTKTQLLISTFCKFHDYLVFLSSCISYFLTYIYLLSVVVPSQFSASKPMVMFFAISLFFFLAEDPHILSVAYQYPLQLPFHTLPRSFLFSSGT